MTTIQPIIGDSASAPLAEALPSPATGGWRVDRLDPCKDPEWDRLAREHPEHTIFHTSAWTRVLVETYGHRPLYLHVSTGTSGAILLPLMEVKSWLTGRRGV